MYTAGQRPKPVNMRKVALLRRYGFLIWMLLAAAASFAQTDSLRGQLVDEKAVPLPFANVALLRLPDSSFMSGVVTAADGRYALPLPLPGNYILRFTAIGYRGESRVLAITAGARPLVGTVTLQPEAKSLKEVSVTAFRPTIIQKPDRMVVSVEGTALAAGNTAYDVLSRSPGVFIDGEGNIQLNGRSGVTVMIDNKLTYLSARELRTMLESMSAENVKNIEIIVNPSARYDAEGASGILNINLRKNTRQGINGSVYGSLNHNGATGYGSGANINHKSGSWNSFASLDYAHRVGGRTATFTRIFYGSQKTTFFDQDATGSFVGRNLSTRLGTDFSINDRHSVGAVLQYTHHRGNQEFLTETLLGYSPGNPALLIDADNFSRGQYRNFTGNVHYLGKLDTVGSLFSVDVDYARIRNHGFADFYNVYTDLLTMTDSLDNLYTDIPSGYDIYAAKADYTKAFAGGQKIEAGIKGSYVVSDNDSRFYFNNGPALELDATRTNHFNYKENIYAAYINGAATLGPRWSVQAGLRMEHTRSTGNLITKDEITRRSYTDFFPSIFVQQKVSESYGITYSYSRRIQRPNYGNLNPFRFYRDPYTWVEGNPFLRPQFAHVFSVTQTFKNNYSLVLNYQLNRDFMAELPRLQVDSAATIYYTGNVDGAYSTGATLMAPVRIMKRWDVNNTAILSYNKFTINVNGKEIVNDELYYSLQSGHTILLPADIRLELTFLYQGPAAYGLYQIAPRTRFDAGIKKSFMNKKIDLTINAVDLFKGQRLKFRTDINGNINDFDQYLNNRNVGITIRYHFSKGQKVEQRRRNNTLEELNRT